MSLVEARYDEPNDVKSTSSNLTQMSTYEIPSDEPSQTSHRAHLPVPMFSREEFSIWHILRQCIGKVSVPYLIFDWLVGIPSPFRLGMEAGINST